MERISLRTSASRIPHWLICLGAAALLLGAVLAMNTNVAPVRATGCGLTADAQGRLQVTSKADLDTIANTSGCLDEDFIQMGNIVVSGSVTPIGSTASPFTGTYDGAGFTISNATISGTSPVGLFARTNNASIRDLMLSDVTVTGADTVGGLIGFGVNTDVTEVTITGAVITASTSWAGGLIGQANADNGSARIADVTVEGTVVGSGFSLGGLVGYVDTNGSGTGMDITRVSTNVTISGNPSAGGSFGGLVGYLSSWDLPVTISASVASGPVQGNNYVGGLVGYGFAKATLMIVDSYAAGPVTGSGWVGGLVGELGNCLYNQNGTVNNCVGQLEVARSYATGLVTATGAQGGLVANTDVQDCPFASPCGARNLLTTSGLMWDTATTGQSASVVGTGKTTDELTTSLSIYADAGWAIKQGTTPEAGKVWGFCAGRHPFLLWDTAHAPSTCAPGSDSQLDSGGSGTVPVGAAELVTQPVPTTTVVPATPTDLVLVPEPADGSIPSLVSAGDAATLEQSPGAGAVLVDGRALDADIVTIDVPAAAVAPDDRTPAQVAAVQAAGEELLSRLTEAAPAGSAPAVTLTKTATGAVLNGVLVDPRNGTTRVPVPVEDVVLVSAARTRVLLAAVGPDGRPQSVKGGVLQTTRRGALSAVAYGLGASTPGEVVLFSTPTLVGSFTTDRNGTFAGQMTLPADLEPGDHTLVLTAGNVTTTLGLQIDPDGNVVVVDPTQPTMPVPSPVLDELPATGTRFATAVAIVAVLLVALGGLLVSRRRLVDVS